MNVISENYECFFDYECFFNANFEVIYVYTLESWNYIKHVAIYIPSSFMTKYARKQRILSLRKEKNIVNDNVENEIRDSALRNA